VTRPRLSALLARLAAPLLLASVAGSAAATAAQPTASPGVQREELPVLRWGGDAEGGAPYVEADADDPSVVRGFDVEVAEGIARALGVSLTGKSPYVPEGLRGKVLSICLEGDVVCNFRWRSLLDVPADIANASCLAPGSVICPHYDYRYSTAHLPTSDEGTAFLARVVLKL